MGIFSFFAPQTEERLHRHLSEILTEYYKIKALVERQKSLSDHLRNIHSRIDSINYGIKHANSIEDRSQRLALLQHLVDSERKMLSVQRMLARDLQATSERIIQIERKTRHTASQMRAE
ncbi:hypothetical protein HYY72_04275 [Candidatus Woesearchaeota archaeon]|nr:hypothetical protein [Candidatus Woesearchaeota archaeon]